MKGRYTVELAASVKTKLKEIHDTDPEAYGKLASVFCDLRHGPRKVDRRLDRGPVNYRIPDGYHGKITTKDGVWHFVYQEQQGKVIKVASLKKKTIK